MQKIPRILSALMILVLSGCSAFAPKDCQYDLGRFVSDVIPLSPKVSYSIENVALTLPVFEIAPDERAEFIKNNGLVSEDRQSLTIEGDGAQPTISIDLLDSIGRTKVEPYRIRVVVGTPISESMDVYVLHRTQGGWNRYSRYCGN